MKKLLLDKRIFWNVSYDHLAYDGKATFVIERVLTEQYVLQQLLLENIEGIYYWSPQNARAEVDFVIQREGKVVPVEVKAAENLQAKSLKVFQEKFNPPVSIKTSMADFRINGKLINLPLYAVSLLYSLIESADAQ